MPDVVFHTTGSSGDILFYNSNDITWMYSGYTKILADMLRLADSLTEKNDQKALSDQIYLTDKDLYSDTQFFNSGDVEFTNSFDILWGDEGGLAKNITTPKADDIIISDKNIKNIQINKFDGMIISDTFIKNIDLSLSDQIYLTDRRNNDNIYFFDSNDIEFFNTQDILWREDDVLAKNVTVPRQDYISLSDILTQKNVVISLQDTVRLIDAISNNLLFYLGDTIIFQDSNNRNVTVCLDDIFKIIDYYRIIEHEAVGKLWRDMVLSATRLRQIICVPIHRQKEEEMLQFSPKQSFEEYYAVFNFSKVITPLTTIETTEVIVYDASGVVVTDTLTDNTKLTVVGSKVYVWVRGGSEQIYKITCKIEMDNGEKFEQDAELEVTEV